MFAYRLALIVVVMQCRYSELRIAVILMFGDGCDEIVIADAMFGDGCRHQMETQCYITCASVIDLRASIGRLTLDDLRQQDCSNRRCEMRCRLTRQSSQHA